MLQQENGWLLRAAKSFPTFCSAAVAGIGLSVLMGWTAQVQILKSILPGHVVMKANTAACLVLIGLALWLMRRPDLCRNSLRRGAAQTVAGLVAVVGLLSLVEFCSGWDLGIDQILFRAGSEDLGGSFRPGMMSPITAAAYAVLGSAVMLLNSRRRWVHWLLQGAASAVTVACVFGIFEFVLDPGKARVYIAPITAVSLCGVSLAVALMRTEFGLGALMTSATSGGELARRLLPAAMFVPILVGWLRWEGEYSGFYSRWTGVAIMTVACVTLLSMATMWTAFLIDRTDRKSRQAAESARRLAAVVTSSNHAIIGKSLDGMVTDWNTGAEAIYGYTAAEMVGQPVTVVVPADRMDEFRAIMQRVARGEIVEQYETVRRRKDGRTIEVSISVGALRDESGNIVGASTIAHDIGERKRAEEALQQERQRFRDVLDKLPVYVVLLTPDYHVALDNTVFRERFGESHGRPCYEFLFQRNSPCEVCETYNVLKDGRPHQWKWTGPDGRHYDIFDFPFTDSDGSPLILEMGMDVTEREEAESARRAVEANLAALIESTGDLVWSVDVNYGLITFNRAFQEHIERSSGIQLAGGMRPEKLRPSEKAPLWPPMYDRALSEGAYRVEYPIADGRTLELSFNPIVQDGHKTGVSVFAKDITERKRAEAELSRLNQELEERVRSRTAQLETANNRLGAAQKAAMAGIWNWDLRSGKLTWSPELFELFGLPAAEQASFETWTQIVHPQDRENAAASIERAIKDRKSLENEYRIVLPGGQERWIRAVGSTTYGENGAPQVMSGICIDVSDRKRAEEALRASEELLRAVTDNSPDAIYVKDGLSRWLMANPAVLRIVGRTAEQALGKSDLELYADAAVGRAILENDRRILEGGRTEAFEEFADTPEGRRTFLSVKAPRRDGQGNIVGLIGISRDITAIKGSEEALRESEQRVRKKLDSILTPEGDLGTLELADILDIPAVQSLLDDFYKVVPVTTGLVDIHGKVLAVPGWQRICKQFHRAHPETCRNCTESDVLLSAGVAPGEFKIYKCKNNMVDVATPVMIGGQHLGNLYFGQFLFADEPIDYELFRAQARQYGFDEENYIAALDAVPRLNRETVTACIGFLSKLSKVISQLSYSSIKLARSSTQLSRVNSELAASNKELEAFSYSVSHDLRAPLRHIIGFSKILREEFAEKLPDEAQHHLQRIEDGTRRMGLLVDDLLNLARVGRSELSLQGAGLRPIVEEIIANLIPDVGDREVEWKIGELPYLECDASLIRQVFQNLLANALKFTRPCSKAVIEVGQTQQDGVPVIFVRDNGVGFSMKYAGKLFGVFQRLHRAEDFEGTGVGLATVQRIVHKHGGRIWAEADLDQGATFYFTLSKTEHAPEKTKAAISGATT